MPFERERSALMLDSKEIEILEAIQSSRTEPYARVVRSRILLAYAHGQSINGIAKKERLNRKTIGLCIDKALASGIQVALSDLPRSGRAREITDDAKAWVVHLACTRPSDLGYAGDLWTKSQLAKHVRDNAVGTGHPSLHKAGKATVQRILKAHDLRPHKLTYYLERRDPEFEPKMAQVLVVYKEVEQFIQSAENTERHKTTISYDEKPGIQAIGNIVADLAPEPGQYSTWARDYEYKRHGTVSLLAGIDLYDGRVIGIVRDRHRSQEFLEFLSIADVHYPSDWKLRIVLDNHSSHVSKATMEWLKKRPNRFEFIFTPKHGSWLNLVEVFFSKMARSFLRGLRVQSEEELVECVYRYLDEINIAPVRFRWKYKLDEVLV